MIGADATAHHRARGRAGAGDVPRHRRPATSAGTGRHAAGRCSKPPTRSVAAKRARAAAMEALLAAYRVGARVAWQEQSGAAWSGGTCPAPTVARFAELVFAYIDELSGASVAGPPRRARDRRPGARAAPRAARAARCSRASRRGARGAGRGAPAGPPPRPSPSSCSAPRTWARPLGSSTPRHAPARAATSRPTLPDEQARRASSCPARRTAVGPLLRRARRSGRGRRPDPTLGTRPHVSYRRAPCARSRSCRRTADDAARHRGAPRRARLRRRSPTPSRPPGARPRTARGDSVPRPPRGCSETLRSWLLHQGRRDASPPSSTSTPRPFATA